MSHSDEAEVAARVAEATSAILAATAFHYLNVVVLNKALFYLDLAALRDFGATVTGVEYVALPLGPVLNDYKQQIASLERAGVAKQVEEADGSKPVVLTKESSYQRLNEAQRELAADIGRRLSKMTSTRATEVSHQNPGWQSAWANGAGSRVNMLVALQQVADEDPWVTSAADEEVAHALTLVEEAVPW